MGFRTTKLGERVSVDTRKMSNGESIGQIKKPSRDKLLQFAFGLSFTEDETQLLLRLAGLCALYPRFKRDYIIMTCIRANKSIWECNDYLIENGVNGVVTEE